MDDHEMVPTGLRTFLDLQPDMSVVGEAGSGEEALAQVAAWHRTSCCWTWCCPG